MNKPARAERRRIARTRPLGRRRSGILLAAGVGVVIGLIVLAIQGMPPTPRHSAQAGSGGDFRMVAYQGEAILGGKETSFDQVFRQGKPVVLNFWAGACAPCNAEMPGFQQISTEYAGRVIVVGLDVGAFVGMGSHDDAVQRYTRLGIHYPLVYAVDASPLQRYAVEGMPTTLFLTAKGQVVDRVRGALTAEQLRSEIQQKLMASS
jgi:thiol-disulfide isomerase/thioredoxin